MARPGLGWGGRAAAVGRDATCGKPATQSQRCLHSALPSPAAAELRNGPAGAGVGRAGRRSGTRRHLWEARNAEPAVPALSLAQSRGSGAWERPGRGWGGAGRRSGTRRHLWEARNAVPAVPALSNAQSRGSGAWERPGRGWGGAGGPPQWDATPPEEVSEGLRWWKAQTAPGRFRLKPPRREPM